MSAVADHAAGGSAAPRASGRIGAWTLTVAATGAVILLGIFARSMNYEVRRDEHLYAPPAVLLEKQSPYADFFYNHVTGSAWLFRASYGVFGDALLLSARLAVFAGWILLLVGGFVLVLRLTRSTACAASVAATLAASEVLLGSAGMAASNNLLWLSFGFVGVALFLVGACRERTSVPLIFASGAALGLGVWMKASGIAFVAPVAGAAFLVPAALRFRLRLLRCVLPLAAGGLLGGAWLLHDFLADPALFLAHVVQFHTGPHAAYWAETGGAEDEVAFSLAERAALFVELMSSGSAVLALTLVVFLPTLAFMRGGSGAAFRLATRAPVAVVVAALLCAMLVGFAPRPAFPQYFGGAVVMLPLLSAALFAGLERRLRQEATPVMAAAAIAAVALAMPRLGPDLPKLAAPDRWQVLRVHAAGQEMRRRLDTLGAAGPVATLAPIYPLEGGLAVYPEFATGQFAYRSAPFADDELLARYRTTSPDDVEAMLAAAPPAALLLGFEPLLEAPLLRFAEARGYAPLPGFEVVDRYGTGRLYVAPPVSGGPSTGGEDLQ